ncbi:endonuclease III domain-containing protein [Fundicoccus culcitae]|uniref:Deoxyribonuclease I n=1 Tax=Fundicoccus culcitae TaxID=2969821 RepID=A0ABY5P9E6_9LACT|nr:deoxyribonuclease I [Fundicoccus culcitae]UUX35372.1 deoxyribonuclease I [Fundicoccus culcitae]
MNVIKKKVINSKDLYQLLLEMNGASGKWAAETSWEIMLGAFLVQNTTWHNTQLSINQLRTVTALEPARISELSTDDLVPLIYSSGFHSSKSQLIYEWFQWMKSYDFDEFAVLKDYPDQDVLRRRLLQFKGIGNETADVLLLYIFNQGVFIADNYARKLYAGLGVAEASGYMPLKGFVEADTVLSVLEWQDFHGQILNFGKSNLKGKGPHAHALFEEFVVQ